MRQALIDDPNSKPVSCCKSCKHLSDIGCTTRNLSCSMFYCPTAIINMGPEAFKRFGEIKQFMDESFGLMDRFFKSENEEKKIMMTSYLLMTKDVTNGENNTTTVAETSEAIRD